MNKVVLAGAIASLLTVPARTQSIRPDEARDRVFGWMKVYDFKDATAPMTVDHRVYSTAQLSVANNFANWIQQSYVPVGGLGDVTRFVSVKLTAGNQETKSLPQSYGAIARIYSNLKYGAGGKIERETSDHILWSVSANDVYGEPALLLSTPEQDHFTLPKFSEQGGTTAMSSRRPWTSRRIPCSGGSRRTSTETPSPAIRNPSCSPGTAGCRS